MAPAACRIPSPRAPPRWAPALPSVHLGPPTRTDVQILAAPGWVPRISSDSPVPGHPISYWNPLPKLGPAWGERDQLVSNHRPPSSPGWGPSGTPGRQRPIPSWDLLPSLQPGGAGPIGCPVRDLPAGSTPKPRDLPPPKSGFPLPTNPEPGEIHWVPASSPANFANFSPGASAEEKLGGHRRPPPPQLPRGPGTGDRWPAPTPRDRRATYPGAAAAAGPRRAATCPQPAAPALAARGPAQPTLLGAGPRAGKRPVAVATAAGGACAEGPGAERGRSDRRSPAGSGARDSAAGQRLRVRSGPSFRKRPQPRSPDPSAPALKNCSWSRLRFPGYPQTPAGIPRNRHLPAAGSATSRA